MHKLIPNYLTYLLPLILSLPATANPVEAEINPPATNQETSITYFHTEKLRDEQSRISKAKNDSNEVVAESISHQRVWSKPVGDGEDKGDKGDKEDKEDSSRFFPFRPTTNDHTPHQTLPLSPDSLISHTHGCNMSLSLLPPNPSTCSPTQSKQVPRTLKQADFPNQPIFAAPNPISQTATLQNPATPSDTSTPNLRVSPRIGGSFTTGPGVGYESSFGGIEGFVPLSQKPGRNIAFLQGRALLSTEDARLGGNVVLGYRTYSRQNNRTFGGYVSYDIRDTGNSTFNQVGLGVESLGDSIDVRANGYIPVGDTRRQTGESSSSNTSFTPQVPNFQGNYLAIGTLNQLTRVNRSYEAAMSGFDAEVGGKLARLGETGALRGYGGLYYYDAPGTAGIVGVRGRLEARPSDNFQLGLSVQTDDKFGTNVVFSVATNFPGTRPREARRQDEVVARLGEGITRQENIVVDEQTESRVNSTTSPVIATNPATNQPYLFQHVNLGVAEGNGTFENPFGTVQNALNATRSDGNDIVYVQSGTNPGIPAFTIPDNVQVLSTGPNQVIPTVQVGNVQLPLSGTGVLPTILPSGSSNVPGVTMGNNTTLSGFAINNATDVGIGNEGSAGTGVNPISNVTIRDNQIAGSGTDGIRLSNVTGAVNLLNNTITNSVTGDGIRIANTSGQANVTITGNNQITGNSRAGIAFLLNNTARVSSTISGNTISNNALDGIFISRLIPDPTGSVQLNNVRISENTINGNGGNGINFRLGGTANANSVTFAENQISSNNGAGIAIDLVDNARAAVTTTGNTIFGNISSGIILQTDGSSNLFSTVSNNTLTNNNTNPGAGSVFGDSGNFVARSGGDNTRVCLNLANNASVNPNPAGADFNFLINPNASAQFLFTSSGNTPGTINFLSSNPVSPIDPTRFTTPLGDCVVP